MNAHEMLNLVKVKPTRPVYCSFCGASRAEAEVMIVEHGVAICGACVDLCTEMVQTYRATWAGDAEYASWAAHMKPPNAGPLEGYDDERD